METDGIERDFSLFIHPPDEWLCILPILHFVHIYVTSKSVKIIKYHKIKLAKNSKMFSCYLRIDI